MTTEREPLVVQFARGWLETVRARAVVELRRANELWASPPARWWDRDEARRIEKQVRADLREAEERLAATLALEAAGKGAED